MISKTINVTSLQQPGLEIYKTLRRSDEHNKLGIFVTEGNKVVLRLLSSTIELVSMLLTPSWFELCKNDLERRPERVTVYLCDKQLVKSIVGFNYHQGIMAVATIPSPKTLDSICSATTKPHFFVALDHLSNAENTGVILRNCAACGVQGVIVPQSSADPYLRRSVRNSMGTVFLLPITYCPNLTQTLAELQSKYGFSIMASHIHPESQSIDTVDFRKNCCIVFGNEQNGVSEEIRQLSDTMMAIPMHSGVDSFNVGCASAIVLYEALRQRQHRPGNPG